MVTSVAFSPVSMLDETKPYVKESFSPWAAKRLVENAGELVSLQSLFSSESKKKKTYCNCLFTILSHWHFRDTSPSYS